jgi:hypothetical protein
MRTPLPLPNLKLVAVAATALGVGIGVPRADRISAAAVDAAAVAPVTTPAMPAAAVVSAQAARQVLSGVGIARDSREVHVQTALGALAGGVREQSHPRALKLAFEAYYSFKAAHPSEVRKPYLYFVDYGLNSHTPRGYVFDMDALRVVDGPFTVAHGRGSAATGSGVPVSFSNSEGSAATSLGLFLTQEVYSFVGHAGGQEYHSVGLRLTGLSGTFNDAARQRRVVVHGAPYVTPSKAGRSEGCPAMEPSRARTLIPMIGNGALVFLFSPNDAAWMDEDPWANGVGAASASAD